MEIMIALKSSVNTWQGKGSVYADDIRSMLTKYGQDKGICILFLRALLQKNLFRIRIENC
jgi:hypothetical protein